jgi:hypothetical protein
MLLFKESFNSLPNNHGKKEKRKEMNAETVVLKEDREDKDVKSEVIVKKDLAELDNKKREEEREDVAETDSNLTTVKNNLVIKSIFNKNPKVSKSSFDQKSKKPKSSKFLF